MHGLWSGWGELSAVLTTSSEEGQTLGAVAGTELELSSSKSSLLGCPGRKARPRPGSAPGPSGKHWEASLLPAGTSPSAGSSDAVWAALNTFTWTLWGLQNVELTQKSSPWWWATPEPRSSAQMPVSYRMISWYHSHSFPSVKTG